MGLDGVMTNRCHGKCQGIVPPKMHQRLKDLTREQDRELHELAKEHFDTSAYIRQLREGHQKLFHSHRVDTKKSGKKKTDLTPEQKADQLIKVYDCKNTQRLPGKILIENGGTTKNQEAAWAAEGTKATLVFLDVVLGRNSIDNRGMEVKFSVDYGRKWNNAMWDGTQMVSGTGDGVVMHWFPKAKDVDAHELGHGQTQYECNLDYQGQSGALNEHLSDALGSVVLQYAEQQNVEQASWLIGEGVLVRGGALRSMKAPGTAYDDPILGKDDQPATMASYVQTTEDNGGVHTNSGIPNHAFYLFATKLGGNSWEKAYKVWYAALHVLPQTCTFQQFAETTVEKAGELFGHESAEQKLLVEAWREVDIEVTP